ncbi:integrase family protein [Tateyamaria sp. Alg231-49]|uniref:tyrosine-type recombinase/integrase n=1 Tax=Tateyamaria sp. Alg231-49 TaxID=1922219 RepID=UPI000D5506BA|nr:integrase family protein [Tateyamaria sp. Alg231-49]
MPKLTETYAKKLPQSVEGTTRHWDSEVKGLVLYVGKRSKTWYFQKDVGGQTKRILIGRYPVISSQAARQTAMELALEMARGLGSAAQLGAPTLSGAMEAYLARPKLRSEAYKHSVRAYMENQLKDWLRLPLDEITKAMAVRRHQQLAPYPSTANHALRYFRSIYNHARRTYDLPECPTMAIEWYEEQPDGRVIENLCEWRQSVDGLDNPIHKSFYQLLLFTGLRKTEAVTLEWENIHDDRIHLPVTKNGRSFDLPILPVHHDILAPMKRLGRTWVFPSPSAARGHIAAPRKLKWSPHAHRRTFATVAIEAGVLEEIVGRLLNHTPPSITGRRYALPSLNALKPAMERVCAELSERQKL